LSPLRKFDLKNIKSKGLKTALFIFTWMILGGTVSAEEKININVASQEELQKIIWVGPATAQKIIDARPFYSLDDIVKVSGIGDKKLADIKEQGIAWVDPLLKTEKEIFSAEAGKKEIIETKSLEDDLRTEEKKATSLIIDVNSASLQELQKITGIGAVLGQRIIDNRPFYSLDELLKVSGIGEAILENIKKQGVARIDPEFMLPETKKINFPDEKIAASASSLYQKQQPQDKKFSKNFPALLAAFSLSLFSGIIILILKKQKNFLDLS